MSIIQRAKKRIGLIKPKRIIIFCLQRSGSNMFTSILNQHREVFFAGQIFKGNPSFQNNLHNNGVIPFNGVLFDDSHECREKFNLNSRNETELKKRNTKEFVESVYRSFEKLRFESRIIAKLHGNTIYPNEIKEIFLEKNDYKVIILTRRNLLQNAISWYQARQQNKWVTFEKDNKPTSINISIPIFENYLHDVKEDISLWRNLVKEYNSDFLDITYEEIINPNFDWNKIWDFLDVKRIKKPAPYTKKLISDYSHIVNISEIREKFENNENGFLN